MNVSNIIYSFLVTIFVILNNPQITKARSENFKSEITNFFGLSMLVGISEAIRLLSTCLLSISTYGSSIYPSYTFAQEVDKSRIEFLNNIIEKYSLILCFARPKSTIPSAPAAEVVVLSSCRTAKEAGAPEVDNTPASQDFYE
jgi:hypothetical protein